MSVNESQIIRIPITRAIRTKADFTSRSKAPHTQDTFVRDRSESQKRESTLEGDIGKLALKHWIESQGFAVTDWDDVRRNGWTSQQKIFDLQVNDHNIEARSSIEIDKTIPFILKRRTIIHPCNVNVKEITVQIYFLNKQFKEALLCGWATEVDLVNFKSPIKMGNKLVDFFRIPFGLEEARPMSELIPFLS